jgi:hypothetical protein
MADYYDNLVSNDPNVRTDVQAEAQRVRDELHKAKLAPENPDYKYRSGMSQTVYESTGIIPAIQRTFERRDAEFEKDPEFNVDLDMQTQWEAEYSENEIEALKGSKSREHMAEIKRNIEEDRDRAMKLSQYGTQGVIQTVATALLDPPALALSAFTGGYGAVAQGSKAIRALKLAGVGSVELGAYEAILAASDTQQSIDNVYSGLAIGGLLGGAIGAATRAKIGKAADLVDESIVTDANRASIASKERTLMQEGVKAQSIKDINDAAVDTVALSKRVDDYETALNNRAAGKVSAKGIDKSIAKVQKQIDSLNKAADERLASISKPVSEFDEAAKAAGAKGVSKEAADISKKYNDIIKKAEAKVKKLEAKPDRKSQAKMFKAQQRIAEAQRNLARELEQATLRAAKVGRTLGDEVSDAAGRLLTKRDAEVAKLNKAIAQLNKDKELIGSVKDAKAELKAWNKLSPQEKAMKATGNELPLKDVTKQLNDVDELVGKPLTDEVAGDTAGAQRVGDVEKQKVFEADLEEREMIKRLLDEGANVDPSLIGKQIYSKLGQPLADRLQALHTTLGNSKSFAVRGLNHMLFESAQGGKARAFTASAAAENYRRQIRGAMRYRLTEGFEDFVRSEVGNDLKSWKNALFDPQVRGRFNKQVMLKVENPSLQSSDGVTKAAEGVRDLYKKAGEISKESGRVGFENLKLRDNYVTKTLNPLLYKRAVSKLGMTKAKELLSKAYQEGHFELPKEAADRIAEARHIQLTEGNLTLRSSLSRYGEANVKQMRKDLAAAGVDESIIEDLMENTLAKELQQGMSNRAKKSLDPSLTSEVDGVRFIDVVDSDIASMTEAYAREAAGESAIAKVVGAKTPAQMNKMLNTVEKSLINGGQMTEKRIAEEMLMLRDGVDLIMGKSINTDTSPLLVQTLSRLRDFTGLLRLQNMGLAAIPETARATTSYGLGAVLESVPNLGLLNPKNLRKGGKMSAHLKRKDLEELDEIMSYYGDDWALHDPSVRYESFEDIGQTGRMGQIMESALAQGRRLQGVTSGFRAVQGGGEKIALRSLATRLKKQLLYGENPLAEWQINDAGWSRKTTAGTLELVEGEVKRGEPVVDDFLEEVGTWMRANRKQVDVNGRKVDSFNFEQMPADMQERLQVGMQRLVYRDMQRMNTGESSTFMNKWLGQTLFQFRSFPMASVEKQLVHDISVDKIHAAQTLMVSAGFAYMAMGIQTALNSVGRDDDYFVNNMTGVNAMMQLMGRMGQTSATQIVGDGLATLGLMPDSLYSGQGRMGYKAVGADYVPIVGVAGDAVNMAEDLVGLVKGDTTSNQVARDLQNLVPFLKTVGVNQAISATISED